MSLEELKITEEDFAGHNIQSLTENTVIGQAEELKRLFDAPAQEVLREKINEILDYFMTTAAGEEIGTPAINGDSGETVAEQLRYLFQTIQELAAGIVPDGSVTDAKLSNAAGQLKAKVAALEEGNISADSPAFTGTPTAPTPAATDNSQRIATTAYVQGKISGHASNQTIHVTSAERAGWNAKTDFIDITETGDLDTLFNDGTPVCGMYLTGEGTGGTPYQYEMTTMPGAVVLCYFSAETFKGRQIAFTSYGEIYDRRYNGGEWSDWETVYTSENYAPTLDEVAGHGQCTDPDQITESGLYYMTGSTTNAPDTGGYMLAAFMSNGRGTQIATINGASSRFWIRSNMTGDGGWQTWRKIVTSDMFSYSSGTLNITM